MAGNPFTPIPSSNPKSSTDQHNPGSMLFGTLGGWEHEDENPSKPNAAGGAVKWDEDRMPEILQQLEQVKRTDMKIAIDVVSLANCSVRDASGNLLPFVWTRQAFNNEFENASLLTREVLKRHLDNFISSGVTENLPLLQKVDDPALLVDWVVRTTEHWERRYALKRDEKYDISQVAMSAMLEVVVEQVLPWLELTGGRQLSAEMERRITQLRDNPSSDSVFLAILQHVKKEKEDSKKQQAESFFWIHTGRHALVRMLFRSDCVSELRERLCMLAGKLLQKKEVCNKPGGYASRQQRSDVIQEYNNVVLEFREWCDGRNVVPKLLQELQRSAWIFHVIDHTAVPVTFGHLQAPAPRVKEDEVVNCPECRHAFTVSKSAAAGAKRLRGE